MVAHPDDDTFGCSGTVALHAQDPDLRFVLVHATSGEKGEIADPSLATPQTLGAVREEEDRRSWVTLGRVPDRHEWLRYPDHDLAGQRFPELVDRIAAILREEHPDVVMTFGPDGVSGHPDHITVGLATSEAFEQLRVEGLDGFRRLLHHGLPQSLLDAWNLELVAQGKEPIDPTRMYMPRGVPDERIGVHVDCTPVVDRKIAAFLRARHAGGRPPGHRVGGRSTEGVHVRDPRDRVAAPGEGDPVLADVFEGLD